MSDKVSQDSIDNIIENAKEGKALKDESLESAASTDAEEKAFLTETEVGTITEISNIFMGSASATLSTLLGNKIDIGTPKVEGFEKIEDALESLKEFVSIEIKYAKGLEGDMIFVLKPDDTSVIADLMMGGDGKTKSAEIGDLQLSAVGEAINQMMGSSMTALSSMFGTPIEISASTTKLQATKDKLDLSEDILGTPVIAITFDTKVGDLFDSEIIQIMPLSAAKDQVVKLTTFMDKMAESISNSVGSSMPADDFDILSGGSPIGVGSAGANEYTPDKPVTVQPVQFASFNNLSNVYGESGKNLDLLMDVKLRLTVELGRSELPIKKVLELTRGSIIELDKVAGEPVELFANGKLIAKGEVVVIEDNFGLRITSIVTPENRIKNI